jgi:hypothetical protein
VPTPGSSALEAAYYPGVGEIVAAVKACLEAPAGASVDGGGRSDRAGHRKEFEGPF